VTQDHVRRTRVRVGERFFSGIYFGRGDFWEEFHELSNQDEIGGRESCRRGFCFGIVCSPRLVSVSAANTKLLLLCPSLRLQSRRAGQTVNWKGGVFLPRWLPPKFNSSL